MLQAINPDFEKHPQPQASNISNMVKKYNKLIAKNMYVQGKNETLSKEMISVNKSWNFIQGHFKIESFKIGQIEELSISLSTISFTW